jgi:hypothetical protein
MVMMGECSLKWWMQFKAVPRAHYVHQYDNDGWWMQFKAIPRAYYVHT